MKWLNLFVLLYSVLWESIGFAEDKANLEVVHRIKAEAFQNSKVMDHLFQLTDVNGPRLTGSPGYQKAAEWCSEEMKSWGIKNVAMEPWQGFGRGWSSSAFAMQMLQPAYAPLHGVPLAWCKGTGGRVKAGVVNTELLAEDEDASSLGPEGLNEKVSAYAEKWKGKLRDKIVLIGPAREFAPINEPITKRLDDKGLTSVAEASEPAVPEPYSWPITKVPRNAKKRAQLFHSLPSEVLWDYYDQFEAAHDALNDFLNREGAVAVLRTDKRGAGGIIFSESAGSRESGGPVAPCSIKMSPEDFNRIWRLAEKGIKTELEIFLETTFYEKPFTANVIGEIPGNKKKDEVVMMGAHLDSWHGGSGATDNAVGCAVVMEAMRILAALDLHLDRTVRIGLWSGEEQGLYGSRSYVSNHFADPLTMKLKPEHSTLTAYFNVDNGSGKIRGIHLQGNDMVRPIFESWMAPFHDLGMTTLTIRDTGYTDHVSFDAVGLPGFQFIQDPLDYSSRTHHSDLDVYDHAEPGDLMQASAVLASFVYHTAMREERLPRKPLPNPLPPKKAKPLAARY